jgi:hypothetical protein
MPLPRFRLQTLMILVAVVAVAIVGVPKAREWMAVSRSYSKLVTDYDQAIVRMLEAEAEDVRSAEIYRDIARQLRTGRTPAEFLGWDDPDIEKIKSSPPIEAASYLDALAMRYDRSANYFRARRKHDESLRRNYQRVARFPWLDLAPDPPPPPPRPE